jgi:hypothetical protein
MKTKLVAVKDAVQARQTKILTIALVATSAVAVVQNRGIANLNDFLREEGLFDKFYTTSDED